MDRVGAGEVFIYRGNKGSCCWCDVLAEGTSFACIWGESILGREGSRYRGAEAGVCLVSGGPLSREVSKWNRGWSWILSSRYSGWDGKPFGWIASIYLPRVTLPFSNLLCRCAPGGGPALTGSLAFWLLVAFAHRECSGLSERGGDGRMDSLLKALCGQGCL